MGFAELSQRWRKMGRRYPTVDTAFHRIAVGGMWDEIGRLQLDALIGAGLRPQHRLLDIGCGALRGGVHFARYLDRGNYFGIDKDRRLIEAGKYVELRTTGIRARDIHLACRGDFNFQCFEVTFDFALAHSIFTHLAPASIRACLENAAGVLTPGGSLLATFFENERNSDGPLKHQPGGIITFPNRDPFHYRQSLFYELAESCGLRCQYVGDWGHPRDQKLLIFRSEGDCGG